MPLLNYCPWIGGGAAAGGAAAGGATSARDEAEMMGQDAVLRLVGEQRRFFQFLPDELGRYDVQLPADSHPCFDGPCVQTTCPPLPDVGPWIVSQGVLPPPPPLASRQVGAAASAMTLQALKAQALRASNAHQLAHGSSLASRSKPRPPAAALAALRRKVPAPAPSAPRTSPTLGNLLGMLGRT